MEKPMTFSEAMAYGAPMPSVAERDDLKAEQAMPPDRQVGPWHSLFPILFIPLFLPALFSKASNHPR